MWYIHTTECYLAVKRNELLIPATTWINLKNIMLSKRSQAIPQRQKTDGWLPEARRRKEWGVIA